MPTFNYKAKKGLDEVLEGKIDAESQEDAISRLIARQLFPVSIEEAQSPRPSRSPSGHPASRNKIGFKRAGNKVSLKDLVAFTQKLATLTKARVELLNSLKILYEQTEESRLKEVILELYTLVKEGKTFSDALKNFPEIFPSLYGSLVAAGEASGSLDTALEQLSDFLYREHSLKNKIMAALAYPALLLSVGMVSVFVLINFVVPRLKPIFQNLGKDLPLITKIILNLSVVSRNLWFWIAGAIAAVIAFLYFKKGSLFMSNLSAKIVTNLPIIKRLKEDQELTHFARALKLLMGGGVTALKALEIASPTVASPRLRAELKIVCEKVAGGSRLSESMESSKMLPSFFVKMIAVGEESGRLAEVLDDITKSYTQQIESDISVISSLLEPVLILILGLVLGTIVLAILLPTFQATQLVH